MAKPKKTASKAKPPEMTTFLVKAPSSLLERLERERARRGLRNRNAAVVAVLEEQVPK